MKPKHSMRCPYCKHQGYKGIDSRGGKTIGTIRRRKECKACKKRWTTVEVIIAENAQGKRNVGAEIQKLAANPAFLKIFKVAEQMFDSKREELNEEF